MSCIVERDDTWDANFEIEHIQGVKSVDLTVYYWEKYDEDSGNEFGTKTETRQAKINFVDDSNLEGDDDYLAEQLTERARDIFNVTYGSIELWNKKEFEACVSDCIIEPEEE